MAVKLGTTIPSQLNSTEVVSNFFKNKHVGYIMRGDKHYTKLLSAKSCSIEQINDREIKVTHHSETPIICKSMN